MHVVHEIRWILEQPGPIPWRSLAIFYLSGKANFKMFHVNMEKYNGPFLFYLLKLTFWQTIIHLLNTISLVIR